MYSLSIYVVCSNVCLSSLSLLSSLVSAIIAELHQDDLITNEECERLSALTDVVRVQSGKSPVVVSKTADILQRHGYEEESRLLAGTQSRPSSICLCYVCCTEEPPYNTCHPCM